MKFLFRGKQIDILPQLQSYIAAILTRKSTHRVKRRENIVITIFILLTLCITVGMTIGIGSVNYLDEPIAPDSMFTVSQAMSIVLPWIFSLVATVFIAIVVALIVNRRR